MGYCSLFVCLFVLAAAGSLLKVVLRKSNPLAYVAEEPTAENPPSPKAHRGAPKAQKKLREGPRSPNAVTPPVMVIGSCGDIINGDCAEKTRSASGKGRSTHAKCRPEKERLRT